MGGSARVVILVAVAGISVMSWDIILFPSKRTEFEEIKKGMTVQEVESIMGCKGGQNPELFCCNISGKEEFYCCCWEDPYTMVNITFGGPIHAEKVIHIDRQSKSLLSIALIWLPVVALLVALSAIGFFGHSGRHRNSLAA